jgi:manganese/zinc/iron transport system permease protein
METLMPTAIVWPTAAEIARVLTLRAGFNSAVVVVGVTLLGVAAGVVGAFVLLRKRALMGDALAHATLPGIGAAFIAAIVLGGQGRSLPVLLAGAALSGVLGVLVVQLIARGTRLPEDAAIGAVLSVFYGTGVVLLSYVQSLEVGDQGGLARFILGQTATMTRADAATIGVTGLFATVAAILLFKEFRLVSFDPDFAATEGWPVSTIDLLMMALLVAVTVVGLQAVGLILIIALVIIPAAAARFWTEQLWKMVLAAAVIGGLSGYIGASASALFPRFPAGGVIVLVAGAVFVFSLLFAPARGIVAAVVRQGRLRLDVASQHVLRTAYEAAERRGAAPGLQVAVPLGELRRARGWSPFWLNLVLAHLAWRGRLRRRRDEVELTAQGRSEAVRVTRNHRLWELFLVRHADLAPSHVDRSADYVEHVLSPDMVAELEAQLARERRLPGVGVMPPSVHALDLPADEQHPSAGAPA